MSPEEINPLRKTWSLRTEDDPPLSPAQRIRSDMDERESLSRTPSGSLRDDEEEESSTHQAASDGEELQQNSTVAGPANEPTSIAAPAQSSTSQGKRRGARRSAGKVRINTADSSNSGEVRSTTSRHPFP